SKRLKSFEKFLDERRAAYDAAQAEFRKQLNILQKRNELTKLGDRAIAEGSLTDYQQLYETEKNAIDGDIKSAANAEEVRVFSAFGPFSPTRVYNVALVASQIHAGKQSESDLDSEDLV